MHPLIMLTYGIQLNCKCDNLMKDLQSKFAEVVSIKEASKSKADHEDREPVDKQETDRNMATSEKVTRSQIKMHITIFT